MKMIEAKYCNSIHLTDAIRTDGTEVLEDILLNEVIAFNIIKGDAGTSLRLTFANEAATNRAARKTNWLQQRETNTLYASMHHKGILINSLYYRNFDPLSNLSEGVKNV